MSLKQSQGNEGRNRQTTLKAARIPQVREMVAGQIFAEEVVRNDSVWVYFEGKRSGFGDKSEIGYKRKRTFGEDSKVFRPSSCNNGNQFRFLNLRL